MYVWEGGDERQTVGGLQGHNILKRTGINSKERRGTYRERRRGINSEERRGIDRERRRGINSEGRRGIDSERRRGKYVRQK